jgi:hypothetical protein
VPISVFINSQNDIGADYKRYTKSESGEGKIVGAGQTIDVTFTESNFNQLEDGSDQLKFEDTSVRRSLGLQRPKLSVIGFKLLSKSRRKILTSLLADDAIPDSAEKHDDDKRAKDTKKS